MEDYTIFINYRGRELSVGVDEGFSHAEEGEHCTRCGREEEMEVFLFDFTAVWVHEGHIDVTAKMTRVITRQMRRALLHEQPLCNDCKHDLLDAIQQ
jgi:hypothetical protein